MFQHGRVKLSHNYILLFLCADFATVPRLHVLWIIRVDLARWRMAGDQVVCLGQYKAGIKLDFTNAGTADLAVSNRHSGLIHNDIHQILIIGSRVIPGDGFQPVHALLATKVMPDNFGLFSGYWTPGLQVEITVSHLLKSIVTVIAQFFCIQITVIAGQPWPLWW